MQQIHIKELCSNCTPAIEQKSHICVGVSPFNSLFSEDYLSAVVNYCREHFESFHLFIPDSPTVYTLLALGYDQAKAKKKTKKQVNWLRNKAVKALRANQVPEEEIDAHILDGKALEKSDVFVSELDLVTKIFEEDDEFKNSCMEASKWVLQNHLSEDELSQDRLELAVRYFLYELPLFAATTKIVGKESSLFCYHQSIDFHEKLYGRELPYKPSEGQGYGLIQIQ